MIPSIGIPAFNEETAILDLLARVRTAPLPYGMGRAPILVARPMPRKAGA